MLTMTPGSIPLQALTASKVRFAAVETALQAAQHRASQATDDLQVAEEARTTLQAQLQASVRKVDSLNVQLEEARANAEARVLELTDTKQALEVSMVGMQFQGDYNREETCSAALFPGGFLLCVFVYACVFVCVMFLCVTTPEYRV